MMITRRSLIKAGGSVILATQSIGRARQAQAAQAVWATHIVGSSYVVGSPPAANGNWSSGFISLNYFGGVYGNAVELGNNAAVLAITDGFMNLEFVQASNNNIWNLSASWSPTGRNTSLQVAWNLSTRVAQLAVNGAILSLSTSQIGFPAPLPANPIYVGLYERDLADVYISLGTPITITPAVIAGFYNTQDGYAVRNSPSGAGAIAGVQPQVFLTGPPNLFAENNAGGSWNWPGNSPSPAANRFSVVGSLAVASSDPFNSGGQS